jgi:hypothetical protein
MQRSEQIGDLVAALAKAQAEFTFAAKDSNNPAFNSKYADLAANIVAVRPSLSKHGIALMQFDEVDLERQTASVTTSLHFAEQYISIMAEAPAVGQKGFNVQSIGACWTYLRRYTLQALCGLASDDDDGNSLAVENKPVPAKAKAAPKSAQPAPAEPEPAAATSIRSGFFSKAKECGWGLGDVKKFILKAYPDAGGSTANLTEEQLQDAVKAMQENKPADVLTEPAEAA